MRQVTAINLAQTALDNLGIHYRELPCREGTFYFCTLSNGVTFDLQHNRDGTVKLWRFVAELRASKAGTRWECCKEEEPETVIGLEVTEGNVSFFAQQIIGEDDPRREARILQMIKGYIEAISTMDFSGIAMETVGLS